MVYVVVVLLTDATNIIMMIRRICLWNVSSPLNGVDSSRVLLFILVCVNMVQIKSENDKTVAYYICGL